MRVIGTAGHVDHGKSTLVAALTGMNPDRLKEERAREMTIELGFAWFTLPDGEEAGVVDVPGHRDFIENMLAGVGGIDAVLFVVAADEGVMPQTREHLAILDLLQVQGGVIALTKTDLIDDPEWLDLVELDIRGIVGGTMLENAPVVRVSARTGAGIEDLRKALSACLVERPPRPDLGRPRLSIDRVFTIPGFGTVVTGTLLDGQLRVGDEVEILPAGTRGRVRGLQTHKKKEDHAIPGSRTAVNISGVEVDQIRRGDVLVHPGKYCTSTRLDLFFRLLADTTAPIHHNIEVKFFLGAAEVASRLRLLGVEELVPGQEGWLQLELDEPVVAVRGDHYILRRPSPGETLGGGIVADPQPARRHKRFSPEVILRLESLLAGSPAELLFQTSLSLGPIAARELVSRARLSIEQAAIGMKDLFVQGDLVPLEKGNVTPESDILVILKVALNVLTQKAVQVVEQYHLQHPLRAGVPKEELKNRLKVSPRIFAGLMQNWLETGVLAEKDTIITKPGHIVRFSAPQQKVVDELLAMFAKAPYSPPSIKECQAALGEEVYYALVSLGKLTPVSGEVVFRKEDYDAMVEMVLRHFSRHDTLTVIEFRDLLNTSRRYVLAFLEHLDALGLTHRQGDYRRLNARKTHRFVDRIS